MTKELLAFMREHNYLICIFRLRHFILDNNRIPVDIACDEVRCMQDMCQQWNEKREDCGLKDKKD